MAQEMPDALQLREAKYGARMQPTSQSELARRLAAAGRVAEALDLFLIAGDEAGAASIRDRAVQEGRPVWLLMLERSGLAVSSDEWTRCGISAESVGRTREAFRAFTRAEDEAGIARVHETLPEYEIYVPQGK